VTLTQFCLQYAAHYRHVRDVGPLQPNTAV